MRHGHRTAEQANNAAQLELISRKIGQVAGGANEPNCLRSTDGISHNMVSHRIEEESMLCMAISKLQSIHFDSALYRSYNIYIE